MYDLLVLGREYFFLDEELKKIKKRFLKIKFIEYDNKNIENIIENISKFMRENRRILILLNIETITSPILINFLTKLEHKGVRYITIQSFMEKYLYKCYIPSNPVDISFLEKIRSFNMAQKTIKIIIDYSLSILIFIIAIPIMLYSIYRIKKESSGEIIYRQIRVGLNGKLFTCYKFRSMHKNVGDNPYTQKNDKRVFPWGKIMRKTRIDELPQIWNILKGDMSLIGPRAEWNILVEKYEKKIPYYQERHLVKPGITGWAQVNYPYGVNSFDAKQKLMYDFYYIKNWSLWLEIKILWRTFLIIIMRKGL